MSRKKESSSGTKELGKLLSKLTIRDDDAENSLKEDPKLALNLCKVIEEVINL